MIFISTYSCVDSCPSQKSVQALQALDQQKQAAQADLKPLLSTDPSTSALQLKLGGASNKHDNTAALADLYAKK